MNEREAHPQGPTVEDLDAPEMLVTCPVAKVNGRPLVILIRKLDAAEIVIARGENPGSIRKAIGLEPGEAQERVQKKLAALPARKRAEIARDFQAQAESLILAAAISPVVYKGRKKPDPRPTDEEGKPVALVALAALRDEDRTVLFEAIMALAEGSSLPELKEGTEAAARLGEFSSEHAEGVEARSADAPAVPPGDPPA